MTDEELANEALHWSDAPSEEPSEVWDAELRGLQFNKRQWGIFREFARRENTTIPELVQRWFLGRIRDERVKLCHDDGSIDTICTCTPGALDYCPRCNRDFHDRVTAVNKALAARGIK